MYLLIIFLPLMGAIGAGFGGMYLGEKGAVRWTTGILMITCIMSCIAYYEIGLSGNVVHIQTLPWMDTDLYTVKWGFLYDSLTVVMLVVVTLVSSLVHLYSGEYMENDPHLPRFMSYLSLFTFFMLILVTADNYLQMFLGWEGVGLCSYLLINFWYTRIQANKAAIQAMLVNRVGDFFLALGIMGIYYEWQAVDYATVFATAPEAINNTMSFLNLEVESLTLISILLFLGAVGKSAQLGLHTWLPNAMEGPTPVSALIHAATMVTAGVFLLARSSPILEYAPTGLKIITIVGAMTAFFAATTGLLQNDLKKVIAYSTCSQLGYMVFACGISGYTVAIFHLANHAFFKALLFLSAGSVIHALSDEQDVRRMGGLVSLLPFTYAMMFIGSLALMGFPFLTGFYSKDVILELTYGTFTFPAHFAYWLGTGAAFFTAFYSIRLLQLTFLSVPSGYLKTIETIHDAPWRMALPLWILSIGSIFIGYLTKDMIIGLGTDFWSGALFTHPIHQSALEGEFLPHTIKLLPVFFSITGGITAFVVYTYWPEKLYELKLNEIGRRLYTFLNRKWFIDKVYTEWGSQWGLEYGYRVSYQLVDRGVIELLGPHGLSKVIYENARMISKLESGSIYHYTLMMLIGVSVGIVFYLLTKFNLFLNAQLLQKFILLFTLTLFLSKARGSLGRLQSG